MSVTTMPQLGIDASRPASASGVPRVASSDGIRKATPLMNRKELVVTNSETIMIDDRLPAPTAAGCPLGISPCLHTAGTGCGSRY
ncbi:hypothetical protein A9X00_22855 [Mycobacterium sp. 1245805.9]|nr:hypothetical protein A9X00_22855 [Mycobacterium sp. 1245805.9]